ncbi:MULTISPECIES: WD40 repeat domain-containing serine/threonine protein kinase [Nonomuraea]|uniref:WD40 repeat domain-containing serine/threonine protein kinase n=1 Tax=Nonomuraea mangrovi TaxID=2316207 RepID=A0ABW4SWA1_9ACTN
MEDPERIGDYWLAGRLGEGGQGVVYEAYDSQGRRVAVKVLHTADAARLAKEATAAQRVASFCTARVLHVETEGPRPHIVSEYVEGPSMRKVGRLFAGDDLHRLATAVATALTAIHEAGVIHRDLKPDNVLLSPGGPRVIDFGIARTADMSLTRSGEVAGTPSYMAPEIFTGQRATPAVDVFAWGAVVLFAATGEDPFRADHLGGVMHRVLSSQPDLSVLPEPLATLVAAAMDKNPAARPAARDLLLALVSGADTGTRGLLAAGSRSAVGINVGDTADPALGTIAEDAYEGLDAQERELAPEVFLRLVAVDEDGQEAGRWTPRSELLDGRSRESVERILRVFSYVVTEKDGMVALSRPALLRAWPRLRMWVDADREGLAVLTRLSSAARQWADHGRRDGDLLQESRLESVLSWAATARRHVTLTPTERDYLRAGTELTRRRARRRRLTTGALSVLLVVALAAGGLAVWQARRADGQRDAATARNVAIEAASLRAGDPVKAMLLTVAAWRISPDADTRSALVSSYQQSERAAFHDPPVDGVALRALTHDGRSLVSVSESGVAVYDVRSGRRTRGWAVPGLDSEYLFDVSVNGSGRRVAVTTDKRITVWDVATGRLVAEKAMPEGSGGRGAEYGDSESTLAVSLTDELIHLWDHERGRTFGGVLDEGYAASQYPLVDRTGRLLVVPGDPRFYVRHLPAWTKDDRLSAACKGQPYAAAFSPDGRTLACAGSEIQLVDVATGRTLPLPGGDKQFWPAAPSCELCEAAAKGLRFSRDGRYLAAFADRSLRVWQVSGQRQVLAYQAEGELTDVRFDGHALRYLLDDTVVTLDLKPRVTDFRTTRAQWGTELSPDGRWALVRPDENTMALWDLAARRRIWTMRGSGRTVFDQRGERLATIPDSGEMTLRDLRTRRPRWSAPVPFGMPPVQAEFTRDGRTLVITTSLTQTDFRLTRLDAGTGRVLGTSTTRSSGGVLTPDGKRMASNDGRFYDLTTGRPLGAGFGSGALAVSDRSVMAVSGDRAGRIALRGLDGGPTSAPLLRGVNERVAHLAFSPGGDLLATVGDDPGTLQLWDVRARRRLGGPVGAYADGVPGEGGLAFSPDGGALYVAEHDGLIHEFVVDPSKMARLVCDRAGRELTEREWSEFFDQVPYRQLCGS